MWFLLLHKVEKLKKLACANWSIIAQGRCGFKGTELLSAYIISAVSIRFPIVSGALSKSKQQTETPAVAPVLP